MCSHRAVVAHVSGFSPADTNLAVVVSFSNDLRQQHNSQMRALKTEVELPSFLRVFRILFAPRREGVPHSSRTFVWVRMRATLMHSTQYSRLFQHVCNFLGVKTFKRNESECMDRYVM